MLPADEAAPPSGLSEAEAQRRLAALGANVVSTAGEPVWRRSLLKFWAPVPWMLEAAALLELARGEFVQAGIIALLLVFNAALGFFQESRAEATLDALKSRLALLASVERDGVWRTIPAAALVPGDLVKLSLGTVVGADVRLVAGGVLLDQSTITGESLPVEAGPGFETYAGALVRRGEAVARVMATGPRTKFGRTAELVRTAHGGSSQQRAVLRVVRNLAFFNAIMVLVQGAYAVHLGLGIGEIVPLVLTAILAAIPVALPATFTLASALGAQALARSGVLPTHLSAIDEAGSVDVLCADKTGTLTRNDLAVTAVRPVAGHDEAELLRLAALASSEGGRDPVDAAIRAAALGHGAASSRLIKLVPFDPARKIAEARATDAGGRPIQIVKGAFATVAAMAAASDGATALVDSLAGDGYRVLAVAAGPPAALALIGLVALSDPPRRDSAPLIGELRELGVRTVMVTGDAPATARVVASAIGLHGPICPPGRLPERLASGDYAVFAGVFPEDKYRIVTAFQGAGHIVGMCGDGANDAAALRQADMGIAVSTATDVAKSAAAIVLTEPGLGGIRTAVREGRVVFQRVLTYTLRSLTMKIDQLLILTAGLIMTGHAILTPTLMVLLMIAGDFLAMSSTTDRVRPSPLPNRWRIDHLTLAGIALGATNLVYCVILLAVAVFWLRLPTPTLQTFTAVLLVFRGQAVLYVVRERLHLWSSRPGLWLMLSSLADLLIISVLATQGVLMAALPLPLVAALFGTTALLAFVLDGVKFTLFRRLALA